MISAGFFLPKWYLILLRKGETRVLPSAITPRNLAQAKRKRAAGPLGPGSNIKHKKKRAAGPPDLAQIAAGKKKASYWPQKDMQQISKLEHHSNGQL